MEILKNFCNLLVLVMGGVTLTGTCGALTRVSPEASRPHRCQTTHRLFAGRRGQNGCDRCRARQFIVNIVIAPGRLGSPVLVDAKGSEYSRYNGELLLTPNRSEAFLAAGYLRSARSRMMVVV